MLLYIIALGAWGYIPYVDWYFVYASHLMKVLASTLVKVFFFFFGVLCFCFVLIG